MQLIKISDAMTNLWWWMLSSGWHTLNYRLTNT